MPQTSRTFRIFVSSTFSDLKAERNVLQEEVFPRLQALCEGRGCRFQAVDLRWGVSEEAALDQQTMNICLAELRRCREVSPRPNFILLLGDRYGWLPLPRRSSDEFDELALGCRIPMNWRCSPTGIAWMPTPCPRNTCSSAPGRRATETEYQSWGVTETRLRGILLQAIARLGWSAEDSRRIK